MTALGPKVPQNWYLLGSANLAPGTVVSYTIDDRELVVYRSEDGGRLVAMGGHCAHMGCHLGKATVRGERLRCPLHFRQIEADGRFARNPDGAMRQATYPLRVFMGGLFVFLGDPGTGTDLTDLALEGSASCYAGEYRFPLPWQWLVANGLDIEHLSSVHDRRLLEPATLTRENDRMLCVRYLTSPTSKKLSDRIMAWAARDGIRGCIRSVAGSLLLVETRIGSRETFILLSFVPQPDGGTWVRGIVGIKGRPGLINRLSVRVARMLFKAFLYKDLGVLEGMQWHEPSQIDGPGDNFTRQSCAFFRELPSA
jgi:nitrite reductase/ring-hydroxylating ferredoxin subunit